MDGKNLPLQMLLLRDAHLVKYQFLSVLEDFDLSPGKAAVLFILSKYGKLTQRQLAKAAGITPPSMTVALRKMEEKGLVQKNPDPKDQRKVLIQLTDTGRERIEDIRKLCRETENAMFQNFSEEEKLLFRRFLLQIEENAMKSKEVNHDSFKEIMCRMYSPMG